MVNKNYVKHSFFYSPGKNTGVGCHFLLQCMKVKSENEGTQSCLTLSDPMDCSLPGSAVHGIFQSRVLEWGAIAFSRVLNIFDRVMNFTAFSRWDSQEGLISLIYVTPVEKNNGSKWFNVNF